MAHGEGRRRFRLYFEKQISELILTALLQLIGHLMIFNRNHIFYLRYVTEIQIVFTFQGRFSGLNESKQKLYGRINLHITCSTYKGKAMPVPE